MILTNINLTLSLMNTKINYCKLSLIIVFFLSFLFCTAQNEADSSKYHIETIDGNTFMGKIIKQDSVKILFLTDNLGEINIIKTNIKEIILIEKSKMKDKKYWFDNPQATRYFFSPNGYGLKAREGYYQNVWVMVNSFAVGLTDNFSIGGGLVPLFFFGETATPVWITPKFSIPISKDNVCLGIGGLFGNVLGEEETGFGILYGISTFGSKDNNLSIGLGYGYAGGDWADLPIINVNIMLRTGARGYFISENYFIQADGSTIVLISLGGRQIIKNSGLDYGLMIPFTSDLNEFIAIPWLGITIPFGK